MKVLVTGAAGFLGGHIVPALVRGGHSVVAQDVVAPELAFRLKDQMKSLEYRWESTVDVSEKSLAGIDFVLHFATQGDVPLANSSPRFTYQLNTDATLSLLIAVQNAKTPILAMSCYDKDTRAMTRRGILSFDQLEIGDEVLTINPETRELEVEPIERIIVQQYEGEMVHFHGKRVDLLVTPNHRMYHEGSVPNGTRALQVEEARIAERRNWFRLPVPSFTGQDAQTIEIDGRAFDAEAFLYLLGIFIADGYVNISTKIAENKTGLEREQWLAIARDSKGRFREVGKVGDKEFTTMTSTHVVLDIPENDKARKNTEAALKRLGVKYLTPSKHIVLVAKESKQLMRVFGECGKVHEKHIPSWVLDYRPRLLRSLFAGIIDGDGHIAKGTSSLSTSSHNLVRDMVEVAYKIGLEPNYHWHYRKGFRRKPDDLRVFPGCTMTFGRHRGVRHSKREFYKGVIWCVKVKNQNLLVVRNGRSAFCGNTENVYGKLPEERLPAKETEPTNPMNIYSASKVGMEALCYAYSHQYGIPIGIIRSSTIFGERSRPRQVVPIFVRQALANASITIEGKGDQTRDFNYVENMVDGITKAMAKIVKGSGYQVWNIGSGEEVSIKSLVDSIIRISASSSKIMNKPPRLGEEGRLCMSIEKAKKELGYAPKISLENGLKRTISSMRAEMAKS